MFVKIQIPFYWYTIFIGLLNIFLQFFNWLKEFFLKEMVVVSKGNPLKHYVVVARGNPTKSHPTPKVYKMTIFAPNRVVAKSRCWYFLSSLKKLKKANGQIVAIHEVHEPVTTVKNYGIWIRYVSRSGIHNMYKEYRDTKLTGAVHQLYLEMASRHRARFSTIHIIRTAELTKEQVKRPLTLQFMKEGLRFPIVSRIQKKDKKFKRAFSASKPSTFTQ